MSSNIVIAFRSVFVIVSLSSSNTELRVCSISRSFTTIITHPTKATTQTMSSSSSSSAPFDDGYYELLGVEQTATIKQIAKAYRVKCLVYHPDKNQDNPKALDIFLRLTKAYDLLTDEKLRAEYDATLQAKANRKRKEAEMDSGRKKMKVNNAVQ